MYWSQQSNSAKTKTKLAPCGVFLPIVYMSRREEQE